MANKNIALQITIGGVEQSIQSIDQLELAIKEATFQLKQFSGSPEEREKLINQIKSANSQLKEFKKEIQGVTVDQQVGKFLQLGSLITSTFATASTVLTSLGMDSTNFAEAQVKAQQVLTIAFTASEIAKQKDTIQTVRNTLAKIANTVATEGLLAATRLLFTTIKANPMGAFLAVLTTVISAIVAFGSQSKKTATDLDSLTQAQLDYNKAVAQGSIQSTIQFESVEAVNTAYLAGQITLNEYVDTINRLLPNLQNINANTREGRDLIFKYSEAQLALGQIESEIAAERAILNAATEKRNEEQILTSRQRIQQLAFESIQYRNTVSEVEKKNKEIGDAEQERLKKLKEAQDALAQARRNALEAQIRQFEIQNTISLQNEEISKGESQLEATLKARIETLKSFVGEEDRFIKFQEKYNKVLKETELEEDIYLTAQQTLRNRVEDEFDLLAKSETTVTNAVASIRAAFAKLETEQGFMFSEQQLEDFRRYTEGYANFFLGFEKAVSDGTLEEVTRQFFDFEQAIIDSAIARGEVEKALDPFGDGWYKRSLNNMDGVARSSQQLTIDLQTAETRLASFRERAINNYTKKLMEQEEIYKDNETRARQFATQEVDATIQRARGIVVFEGATEKTNRRVILLRENLSKLRASFLEAFALENIEDFTNQFDVDLSQMGNQQELLFNLQEQIRTKNYDSEEKYKNQITDLSKQLSKEIPQFANISYEAKLEILAKYLDLEITATEDAEKKKQDAQQKSIDKFLQQIQAFQTGLQAIQQTVADYYNFQFDQLEKRNKRIQDSIVGESERANELRLEADKAYTAEREKLEKQQAKISLRLTLAQTIANVAQAVAQSLDNPILAAIVGVAGAAQVAIITRQIQTIDAYQRGGKIRKGQGGMVVGPPHEQGGVKFQGGGIELEGNEAVINRMSTLRYADILSTINQAGGGRPIVMNGFDDSRIVEAIAKQRQTPIRAFVVESDITNAQTINKRLELLSQI